MKNTHQNASDLADQIEAELRNLGLWASHVPLSGRLASAFGADQLSFEEWLQAVLLPRLRDAGNSEGLPKSSSLAVAGVRNFDGIPNVERLLDLLAKVDALAESGFRK